MPKDTLIFDLDGTLADTAPDLIGTLNRITGSHGLKPVGLDQVGQIVGHGAKAMILKSFEISAVPLPRELHEKLFAEFLEDYAANIANETVLFSGLSEAMESLHASGFSFAVCTNKTEHLARILLDELEITYRFKAITGGDTFAFRKPDARHLGETAKLMGRSLQSAIMIGDSATDINAAKNAGIPSVAVTFGYSDQPIEELGATQIIDHFDALENAINKIIAED